MAIFPLNDRFKGREATNSYPQARNFHKVWFHTPEETNPNIGLGACVFKIGTSLEIPMKSPINNHTSITILWFLNYKEMDPSEYDNDFHHSFMDFQANKGEKSNYALHGFGFRTHMVAKPRVRYLIPYIESDKEHLAGIIHPPYTRSWKYMGFTFKVSENVDSPNSLTMWEDGFNRYTHRVHKNTILYHKRSILLHHFKGYIACLQIYNTALTAEDVQDARNACNGYQ